MIKKYKVDTSYLSERETQVLKKLVQAAEAAAKIYEAQLRSGFYPASATRAEIEKAAQTNPEILSPYTMVERDENGKLIAVFYHIKYRQLILPVVKSLAEAAEIEIHHQDFRKALLTQARSLLNGTYDKAQIEWMKIEPFILDIVIGPYEKLEDTMFFTKTAYQCWVGIMNKTATSRLNTLKTIVSSSKRRVLVADRLDFLDQAQVRADETVIFSGLMANHPFTAATLPDDIHLLEKSGSETWVFLTSAREQFEARQYKLFNLIFEPSFKKSFSKVLLLKSYFMIIALHEIARVILRYRFAADRLRELYPVFSELAMESLALKMSGSLLLKDAITSKEMEGLIVMFLTRIFDGYIENNKAKSASDPYIRGNAILLNYLIDSGGLKVTQNGISWPDFNKMFISISELTDNMEKILTEGTYLKAQEYLKKHSPLAVFKKYSTALKALRNA